MIHYIEIYEHTRESKETKSMTMTMVMCTSETQYFSLSLTHTQICRYGWVDGGSIGSGGGSIGVDGGFVMPQVLRPKDVRGLG